MLGIVDGARHVCTAHGERVSQSSSSSAEARRNMRYSAHCRGNDCRDALKRSGDLRAAGTTHATFEVLNRFTEGHDPDIVLLAGDHTCALPSHSQRRLVGPPASRSRQPVHDTCSVTRLPWMQCMCTLRSVSVSKRVTTVHRGHAQVRRQPQQRPALLGRVAAHAAA